MDDLVQDLVLVPAERTATRDEQDQENDDPSGNAPAFFTLDRRQSLVALRDRGLEDRRSACGQDG